jgi:predicted phosphoribosyltransferase
MRFADFQDAGAHLDRALREELSAEGPLTWCPIEPNGVTVLAGMDTGRDLVLPITVERTESGVLLTPPSAKDVAGSCVIVVDDGVETGTVARAAAAMLKDLQPARIVLAVPVCPREVIADLQHRYDQIVAVDRPLVRRDLRWHYTDMT